MIQPEKEKAPEGAQTIQPTNDKPVSNSQGFLEAKEWLGRTVFESYGERFCEQWPWDGIDANDQRKCFIDDAWSALVAVHGEESARIFLTEKYEAVKRGEPEGKELKSKAIITIIDEPDGNINVKVEFSPDAKMKELEHTSHKVAVHLMECVAKLAGGEQ